VKGKPGQALDFDGSNDYVNVPAASVLDNITSALTISAWVKLDSLPGSIWRIVYKGSAADTALDLNGSSFYRFVLFNGSGYTIMQSNSIAEKANGCILSVFGTVKKCTFI
jgi:hypothetical protein